MVDGAFLWVAMTAGAFALVTPCVFPMIPVTASYFANHGGRGRRGAANALLFGAGIVGTFTAVGVGASVVVGASGMSRFAANPWVNLGIAALFVAFALNFLGCFEIRIPAGVSARIDRALGRAPQGSWGAVLMGALFAVTTFTCTAPFVGTLLVLASQGEWQQPALGLVAFSATFAVPFFLLALAPGLLGKLPRAGSWLGTAMVLLGLIELGAALKFVANADLVMGLGVVSRQVVLVSWATLCFLAAVYLLAAGALPFARRKAPSEPRGLRRPRPFSVLTATAFAIYGAWLALALDGRPLGELEPFLPPRAEDTPAGARAMSARGEEREGPFWHLNDLDAALVEARAEESLVFIDFTGYTCTNCRWMESNMFEVPEVRAHLERFVLARLYTDGEGEVYRKNMDYQKNAFGTIALPLYAVVDENGATISTFLGLTRDRGEFLRFLEGALSAPAGRTTLSPSD